jgi:hypothetical protein
LGCEGRPVRPPPTKLRCGFRQPTDPPIRYFRTANLKRVCKRFVNNQGKQPRPDPIGTFGTPCSGRPKAARACPRCCHRNG